MLLEIVVDENTYFPVDIVAAFHESMVIQGFHPDTILEAMEQFLRDEADRKIDLQ